MLADRTLVYCTAYAQTDLIWRTRYRRWVDAVMAAGLGQQQIVIVDDGSPVLPGWRDTDIATLHAPEDATKIRSDAPVLLLRYANRLGRIDVYNFPGWHRSFITGARYGLARKFRRIIHLESDAFIVSARLRDWLRDTTTGWRTLWSAKFDFPEIAIQLICQDQHGALDAFIRRPYADMIDVTHETALPCTHVERAFTGDRYGEDEPPVPAGADFATQLPGQREPSYYWFLQGRDGPPPELPGRLDLAFGRDDAGFALLGDGWAKPELNGSWMVHAASNINLPRLPAGDSLDLVLIGIPHVQRDHLLAQRLIVQVNLSILAEFDFPTTLRVGCEIPAAILRRDGTDRLRLLHPNAAQPSRFGVNDARMLALKVSRLSLIPRAAAAS